MPTDLEIERAFWAKVDIRGPTECWEWKGYINPEGYGLFQLSCLGTMVASRITYILETGKDPGKLCVCHKCDNPACCNPKHLFLGTQRDNQLDAAKKGRQDKRGQPTGARTRKLNRYYAKHYHRELAKFFS